MTAVVELTPIVGLDEYVRRVVAEAPPLTAEQRERIAALLTTERRTAVSPCPG